MALPEKQTEDEAVLGAGEIISRYGRRRLQV
jgi:hypothetical protein